MSMIPSISPEVTSRLKAVEGKLYIIQALLAVARLARRKADPYQAQAALAYEQQLVGDQEKCEAEKFQLEAGIEAGAARRGS